MKIRTRYAPSPTGRMHVGNLRTALYAYLIARHAGGDFLLRIEDTDQERFVEGATQIIYRTLQDAGLNYDEGPDKDGGCGPYVQSERRASGLYLKHAKELIGKGEAYYCFCTPERLRTLAQAVSEGADDADHADADDESSGTKMISVYDKHCLSLSEEEIAENLKAGKPYVIRQNNPTEGETTFHDEIYGDVRVDNKELDDMILIKSDGYPTYNFANVVDDHLMGITHVVRGNEYISSTPKYQRLYEAFGWTSPAYIHCPLITDETHKKLSKRSGHASFEDLTDLGYLPEAIVNFVALLGWSPEDNTEMMSLAEMEKIFDYRRISKSPAVFDMTKLKWMNGEYLKAMEEETFYKMAKPYLTQALPSFAVRTDAEETYKKISAMVKTRIELCEEIPEKIRFFESMPDYDPALYTHKKMKTDAASSLDVLTRLQPVLEAQTDYTNDALYAGLKTFIDENGYKNGQVLWPVRIAVTGTEMTPCGATEAMEILGKEETLRRLTASIEKLQSMLNEAS